MHIEGSTILVTGASSGIGEALAPMLAERGATVGIAARRADRLAATLARCQEHAPASRMWAVDLSDVDAAVRVVRDAWTAFGHLDCLVNNAAVRDRRPLEAIAADDFRRLMETNLVAQYELSRVAARHMAGRGQGRLVFVSSMVGPQSFQGDPAYVASKGGLEALMRALAVELGQKGIAANAIAPGFFLTDGNAPFFSQPRVVELARRIPLQRFGLPDELVGAAIFLASDAASYITGQVLTVDAGLSIAL
jgi:gluconate 5-dehydrogenase